MTGQLHMYSRLHEKRHVTRRLTPYLISDYGQLLKHTVKTVEMSQCKIKDLNSKS